MLAPKEFGLAYVLDLAPLTDRPDGEISLTQALDDAYFALHSPLGISTEQYVNTRQFHSQRLRGVTESFVRRVVLGGYRDNLKQVVSNPLGCLALFTDEIQSNIWQRRASGWLSSGISFEEYRLAPKQLDSGFYLTYDSENPRQIGSGEICRKLKIKYLYLARDSSQPPVARIWEVLLDNGLITNMNKCFTVPAEIQTNFPTQDDALIRLPERAVTLAGSANGSY